MTTNLLMLTPQVPDKALRTRTTDTWGDTNKLNDILNNRCGEKGNLAKLQTGKTGRTVISYDMGASDAQSVDTLAIARADLLTSDSVAALIVRAASAPYLAPSDVSSCVAWFDPSYGVTTDTNGGVSAWVDRVGAISAAQSTSTSRPMLTRYDNKENRFRYSETLNSSPSWANARSSMGGTMTSGDNTLYFLTEDGTAANTHYLYLNTASYGINTVSGKTYNLTFKVKSSNRNISVRALSGFAGGYTTFNIQSNSIIETAAEGANATITDLGGGVYQCSVDLTANANVADAWVIFYLYNGNRIYTGDTVSGAYIGRPQFRLSTTDSTYVATTAAAVIAGINGSRWLDFDGVNDRLLFTNTPAALNLTGDFTISCAFRLNNLSNNYAILNNENRDVAGYFLRILTSGAAQVLTNTSGAHSSVNASSNVSAGTVYSYSAVRSSGTLTHYINGTSAGSGALTAAATALAQQLYLGYDTASTSYFSGQIGDVAVFSGGLSSTDRQSVEAYLTAKYSTTPLIADYAFAGNSGEDSKDYVSRFTASSSSRHYWIEMESSASSKFTHSKLFLGTALDLGDTVDDYSCSRDDTQDDDFTADSGAVDVARGKPAPYKVGVTWRGDTITDTMLATFHDNVIAPSQTRFGLFLITTTNHEILDGLKSLYVRLKKAAFPRKEKTDYNIIDAEFEELPG